MDKKEALEIYLKLNDECSTHDCKDCVFNEPLYGGGICILDSVSVDAVARYVRNKLKSIDEKQEAKPSVPLENVGSIIIKEPSKAKELAAALKDSTSMTMTATARDKERDNVNHPKHYCKGGLECIQVIKAQLTPEQYKGYLYGNVLKYMWRWQDKNGLEDLRKAAKYLEWLIKEIEK